RLAEAALARRQPVGLARVAVGDLQMLPRAKIVTLVQLRLGEVGVGLGQRQLAWRTAIGAVVARLSYHRPHLLHVGRHLDTGAARAGPETGGDKDDGGRPCQAAETRRRRRKRPGREQTRRIQREARRHLHSFRGLLAGRGRGSIVCGSSSSPPGARAGLALRPGREGGGAALEPGSAAGAGAASPADGELSRLMAMARARLARSSALCPYSIPARTPGEPA